MRILFIIPSQYCMGNGKIDRNPFKVGRIANMAVLQVAACTPPGHEIEIIDDHFEEPDYEGDYDLVGLTCMTPQAPRAFEIAAQFRQRGKTVVIGGFHATLSPDDAAKHADAIVIGEAEATWPKLIDDFQKGRLQPRYSAEGFIPIADAPIPRYDLLARKGYAYISWPVQISRGCPLVCSFCSVTQFYQRSYRVRPVERVLEAIQAVPSRNIFFIDDDLFIARPSYLLELFKAIEPLGITWYTQADLKSADNDDLLAAARRAGCTSLYIGIESFNSESLAAARKDRSNKLENYGRIIQRIQSHGISITASCIVGLEHDRPSDYRGALEFLIRNKVSQLALYMLIPLPGTPMTQDLEKAGRVRSHDFNLYTGTHELVDHPNFKPGEMASAYWEFYEGFYSLRSIVSRFSRMQGHWRDHLALLFFNVFVLGHWVRRRVHPFIANGFPLWLAALLRVRSLVLRGRGGKDASALIQPGNTQAAPAA